MDLQRDASALILDEFVAARDQSPLLGIGGLRPLVRLLQLACVAGDQFFELKAAGAHLPGHVDDGGLRGKALPSAD